MGEIISAGQAVSRSGGCLLAAAYFACTVWGERPYLLLSSASDAVIAIRHSMCELAILLQFPYCCKIRFILLPVQQLTQTNLGER